jgi:hypothetical protein
MAHESVVIRSLLLGLWVHLTYLAAQDIKRVTASVVKFADEICRRGPVTVEVCPFQINLRFHSIITNVDNRAFLAPGPTLVQITFWICEVKKAEHLLV